MRMFQDDELPGQWLDADLNARVAQGRPEADALVLRVLAARIALAGGDNQEPLATIRDLSRAVESIAAAVEAIIEVRTDNDLQTDDEVAEARTTVERLARASDGLHVLTGWF